MNVFSDIYKYRELLKTNIKKDIRGKYKGSFLGILWSFLTPLLQVLVYWIVFPYLLGRAGTEDNYLCYLVTGIIPWTFFTSAVTLGTICIKINKGIIVNIATHFVILQDAILRNKPFFLYKTIPPF